LGDLVSPEFPALLKKAVDSANDIITKVYGDTPLEYGAILKTYTGYIARFKPFIRDKVEVKINKLLLTGSRVIFEGSHGTFLDISHGCYPAVSAESTTASGICAAAGVGPTRIAHTLGVAKAYGTHLGGGPFPTQLKDSKLISHFHERYGAFCPGSSINYGWVDVVQIRQAALLNGVNSVVLTHLDDLDGLDEIKICTHYELDGMPLYDVPPQINDLKRVVPKYLTIKGWKNSIRGCKKFTDLPEEARNFVKTFEHVAGVIVSYISVGPDKNQVIELVTHLLPRPTR
jgi:adenylosuccinate synthase